MSQKRQQREESSSCDERRPRKFQSFKSVVMDVMNLRRLQNFMEPVLEPLIRRVVKEEVDSALRKYIISMKRNCGKDAHPSESRSLKLQFLNVISLPVFTGTRIEGEACTSLEVALINTCTNQVVSDGPGSSAKVEIVVLEGDFDGDEKEDWTLKEFGSNIVREREGKKPLLTGDLVMNLSDGKGFVGDVLFTDNSSWTRSRKFRLGARLLDDLGGVRVREARSEPFVVRDHRGELYKKHYPPSLSDEVWRLEKIGKDGAFHKRLKKERVNTVKDFLSLLNSDPTKLRTILGTGMSAKMWEVTVEHARTCVLNKKLYSYHNVVGQVTGIPSNGQFVPAEADKEDEVISSFADQEKIVTLDNEASLNMLTPSVALSSTNLPSESCEKNGELNSKVSLSTYSPTDYMQSLPSIGELSSSFDDCFKGIDPMYNQPMNFSAQADSVMCDTDSIERAFCSSENWQFFDAATDCSLQGSNLEFSEDITSIGAFIHPVSSYPIYKAQHGWNVLLSLLKWRFSIKKRIVARKTQMSFLKNR